MFGSQEEQILFIVGFAGSSFPQSVFEVSSQAALESKLHLAWGGEMLFERKILKPPCGQETTFSSLEDPGCFN